MNKFKVMQLKLQNMEQDLYVEIDKLLIEAGMAAVVMWAEAFPKRYLRFVSGMGTATFGCPTLDRSVYLLDLDDYVEENTSKVFWNDRAAAMVQPLTDYMKVFWSFEIYKYPSIPDIIYNPVTRTVECGSEIIQLDMIQVEANHG